MNDVIKNIEKDIEGIHSQMKDVESFVFGVTFSSPNSAIHARQLELSRGMLELLHDISFQFRRLKNEIDSIQQDKYELQRQNGNMISAKLDGK